MKLANGSGSIVCLDKTGKKRRKPYAVRITNGWSGGKQKRTYLGYYKTQADALIALAEYHKNGLSLDLSKLTLLEVFDKFLERVEKKNLSRSVMANHNMVKLRLDTLANMPIKEVKTPHLQTWIDNLELKTSTKQKAHSSLKQVYDYAVSNDIVVRNYMQGVEVTGTVEKTGAIFTDDEIKYLWDNTHNEMCKTLLILIYTGLRIGELIDIHADNVFLDDNYMIGGNKTAAGKNRTIPIHKAIKPFIEERLAVSQYILHTKARNKGKITYAGVKHQFRRFLEETKWEHKIHDTRKTAVSVMHTAGIPMEVIRIIIGHSGKGVTESVYLYKNNDELVEWINKIEV